MGSVLDPITDETVARSRDSYRMLREGDPRFFDRVDPEVDWHVPDTLPGGGDLHGTLEVLEFIEAVNGLWEDAYPEPDEFLAAGDKLIVLGTWHGRAISTGVRLELPFAHVLQYRDGMLVYFRNYIDAAKALRSLEETPAG